MRYLRRIVTCLVVAASCAGTPCMLIAAEIKEAPHPFLGKQVWFDEMIVTSDTFFKRNFKQ